MKRTDEGTTATKGIFQELERESSLKGISMEFSREARKFTQEVEVPKEYQRHARIFDPVESKKLPPSQPWDHANTLKPDALDTINCKLGLIVGSGPHRYLQVYPWEYLQVV